MTQEEMRFQAAAMAMQGLLTKHGLDEGIANVVDTAVELADDLLEELSQKKPTDQQCTHPRVERYKYPSGDGGFGYRNHCSTCGKDVP